MDLPSLEAADDRPPTHSQRKQLSPGDDSVLFSSQPLHLLIKRSSVQLSTPEGPNCTSIFHTADPEAAGRTWGAQDVQI